MHTMVWGCKQQLWSFLKREVIRDRKAINTSKAVMRAPSRYCLQFRSHVFPIIKWQTTDLYSLLSDIRLVTSFGVGNHSSAASAFKALSSRSLLAFLKEARRKELLLWAFVLPAGMWIDLKPDSGRTFPRDRWVCGSGVSASSDWKCSIFKESTKSSPLSKSALSMKTILLIYCRK